MSQVKFSLRLIGSGDPRYPNVAGVEVPARVVSALGDKGRIPIKGTINGFAFRTTICVMGGKHFFCVNRQMREGGGNLNPGDAATFIVENDNEERTVKIPPGLARALKQTKGARDAFDAMSFTHRKEHVLAIEDAKKPERRARRIEKSVAELLEKEATKRANPTK